MKDNTGIDERLQRLESMLIQIQGDVSAVSRDVASLSSTVTEWQRNIDRFWTKGWSDIAANVKEVDQTVDSIRAEALPAIDKELHALKARVATVAAAVSIFVGSIVSVIARKLS